jgi:hypothetical protein
MNPAVEFLLYPTKFTPGWIPFFKTMRASADLGVLVGTTWGETTRAENEAGVYMALGQAVDLYSPEIQKYEFSALGSTRII